MSYSRSSAFAVLLLLPSVALGLSPDETILLNRVRAIAAAPIEDFRVLGETGSARDGCYRYQLAFLSYGLCSVVEGEPALREEGRVIFTKLVEPSWRVQARTFQTIGLFARTFRGWSEVLDIRKEFYATNNISAK
jgi:hypothetical protein